MKLSKFKEELGALDALTFVQPNGKVVPLHFHITEVGIVTKSFIDCGGTIREEKAINFQLWEANDFDHRLSASKLLSIIDLSEKTLNLGDYEVEVEYQTETIGRYGVAFDGNRFLLTNKLTDCLAKDKCGIPVEKQRIKLQDLSASTVNACTPGSDCCN